MDYNRLQSIQNHLDLAAMADSDQHDVTQELQRDSARDAAPAKQPEQIGRYRIERLLGKGGFGLVYLAHDEQLDRPVAVKVPHAWLISQPKDAEAYLAEARTVANLDHPNIVPVHDVGTTEEFPCYVVSKYIEGTDLATMVKESSPSYTEAAELVATVAEALHYAHKQGLVHRDVKPGNILIGNDGKPYMVDFGLALREENVGKGPKYAGTPAYMSPEQARGEGHRVDGRSDIFSLGVVFYELLVRQRPFNGDAQAELLEQISSHDPKPPRQHDDAMPKELERICLKALAKRATERYTTAKDLADDLRHFLSVSPKTGPIATPATQENSPETQVQLDTPPATPGSDSQPIKIVPKGLRSFDEHDADFFLELLPGARDREGLPDSIRFWKTRIEETDVDKTFSVGLIYGPSGCGKSSLVKAGLLPRLSERVIPIYVEATPDETETRLLRGLRKHCPALPENISLKETLTALRQGQGAPDGKKLLIVLDQFEQWLHAKKEEGNTELVQALRQCDGARVQCVVMVRDDFWMAATRFMRELEIRLVEAHNSAAVDLFPVRHTQRVLAAFGRAFGILPENSGDATDEQKAFLQQAATDLAEENKVICVRLALFAEMMKGRSWTPAVLNEVGGATGIGLAFLEETFAASSAPPERRYHQKAARAVLKALLPETGTDIKGHMRSQQELLEASGYAKRPQEFDDLIRILDSEIRLITPTDPEGMGADDDSNGQVEARKQCYQLTHDYLVPSLRDWLTRKQRETRRGRAELRLAELAADWNAKRANQKLPSVNEYVRIRMLTRACNWSSAERQLMSRAKRVHRFGLAVRTLVWLPVILAVLFGYSWVKASILVDLVIVSDGLQRRTAVARLRGYRVFADSMLRTVRDEAVDQREKDTEIRARYALVPTDLSELSHLARLGAGPQSVHDFRDIISPKVRPWLLEGFLDETMSFGESFGFWETLKSLDSLTSSDEGYEFDFDDLAEKLVERIQTKEDCDLIFDLRHERDYGLRDSFEFFFEPLRQWIPQVSDQSLKQDCVETLRHLARGDLDRQSQVFIDGYLPFSRENKTYLDDTFRGFGEDFRNRFVSNLENALSQVGDSQVTIADRANLEKWLEYSKGFEY